ncbi:hypothetical protein [uncultured Sphingomonas sp.]|uniref:hypothetical protein n=1 Tax=uncultured Sphingomonas sp. TaxID=158754 RepID=UPI00261F3C4F|nr:hypothetical protein [uncultured Sphingomonas sp.]
MARTTTLEKDGAQRILVVTDERGTRVLDEFDDVLTTYGDDRHDEAVRNYVNQGWVVVADT